MKNRIYRVETISELHEIAGFEKPRHPLVSVVDYSKLKIDDQPQGGSYVCGFYGVNFKNHCSFIYGRQSIDHQEGTLLCTAPEQVITYNPTMETERTEGWGLYFHPELIRNSPLGRKIKTYSFFAYGENEALHLSEQEKQTLFAILKQLENEYNTNIDHYSHELIISNIELLLNYCRRFYGRQFITRTNHHQDIIAQFEAVMMEYYTAEKQSQQGIPSVKYCAEALNLSPNYLSDVLKSETGKNAQDHIHYFLLEQAKNQLVGSNLRINEIAFSLGFEYPQNFCKLLKKKVGISPSDFRTQRTSN